MNLARLMTEMVDGSEVSVEELPPRKVEGEGCAWMAEGLGAV